MSTAQTFTHVADLRSQYIYMNIIFKKRQKEDKNEVVVKFDIACTYIY